MHVALDALLLSSTFVVVHRAQDHVRRDWLGMSSLHALETYAWVALAAVVAWIAVLRVTGAYHSYRAQGLGALVVMLVRSGAIVAAVLGLVLFAVKDHDVSRALVFGFVIAGTGVLVVERVGIRLVLEALRRRSYNARYLLLMGPGPAAQDLLVAIDGRPGLGLKVIGSLVAPDAQVDPRAEPVLGGFDDLEEALERRPVDEVAFFLSDLPAEGLSGWLAICAREGVRSRLFFLPSELRRVESYIETVEGIPSISFGLAPSRDWQLAVKRTIDVVVALLSIVLLAPLLLGVVVAIRLSSPGPVLFRQQRYGLNKRRFTLLKFRTMVDGAEHRLQELMAHNEMDGPVFKMRKDPRVTPLGRRLRASSIDELPQLWNVLMGQMSLVGPRPPTPDEVDRYEPWQRRRLSMKPGLTGPWQVNGRNQVDFASWMSMDMDYVDNWSLARDLRILAKTLPAILRRQGAW